MSTAPMRVASAVVFALTALVSSAAPAQELPHGPTKPAFSVALVDESHCKAWQEFRKLLGERQWSKAFRAISDDLERPPDGLLPAEDGFSFEWPAQVRRDLGSLDTEGRRAFDLFFGGRAKKLLESALEKPASDPTRAELLVAAFNAYGVTTAGTKAGDRLASDALASGRPAEAVEIWEWILKSGATDGYDPPGVRLGLCKAFAALGKRPDFDRVAVALEERWGGEAVEENGVSSTVRERVAQARVGFAPATAAPEEERLDLPKTPVVGWESQSPEAPKDKNDGRMRIRALGQVIIHGGGGEPISGLWTVAHGNMVFVCDGSRIRAIDAETGQLKWNRSHHWEVQAPIEPWILPSGDHIFIAEIRNDGVCKFTCRDFADGGPRWTADLDAKEDCIGPPLVDGNDLYVAFRESGAQRISLCALDAADGKKRWSLDLGTATSGGGEGELGLHGFGVLFAPQVRMVKSGGRIFVFIDGGATICVDPVRRRVCWAALLENSPGPLFSPGPRLSLICEGSVAYATFRGSRELVALDLDRAKVLWRRPIDAGAGLAAVDRDRFYVVGQEICAYARNDRKLEWARPLGSSRPRILTTRDHLYVIFAGGLHEIAKKDGDDVRVVRGDHAFFRGGDLWRTPAGLVSVGDSKVALLRTNGAESEGATTVPKSKEDP